MLRSLLVLAAFALAVPLTVLAADDPAPPAGAARTLPAPVQTGPAADATVQSAPVFSWKRVRGADEYEFQLSADSQFRSLIEGGSAETANTAYTLDDALPDGAYHWRVRAVSASGNAGRWSKGRSVKKRWSARPALVAPSDGATVDYPSTPVVLRWEPVPHAVGYVVTIAADSALASPVVGTATRPLETSGTAFALQGSLDPGEYWWAVTPVNAGGHRGARSEVGSFTWRWPSTTSVQVTDLNTDPRVYDPQFSWGRVPGAARYEVEVNSSADFAVGSKVCCSDTTLGTTLTSTKLFPNNTYYWRVRALDADDRSGVWNVGAPFQKTFDPVEPFVPGLALQDNQGPIATGSTTSSPVVTWNPVPGAASYDVQVVPYVVGGCNWGAPDWQIATATTAWTPLARGGNTPAPPKAETDETDRLKDGESWCVRVRGRTGTSTNGSRVVSEWTYLDSPNTPAFTYSAPAGPIATTKLVLGANDYVAPVTGVQSTRMPLFRWKAIAGACGYFVVVAKDAEFTTILDVARTKIPAYAPRKATTPQTYPDETTLYYWAAIPVVNPSCGTVYSIISENHPQSFRRESTPPDLLAPAGEADVADQPTFRWTAAEGAKEYRLQVAHDPAFGNLIDDVVTASTAYTSSSTYPADALLYWRVRANDENAIGLTWSPTRTFRRRLPAPAVGANPEGGEGIPMLSWSPVSGAISYDVNVEEPDGDVSNFTIRSTVFTPVKTYGLGVWQWRVRANFPTDAMGKSSGAYSAKRPYTRYMNPPTGAHATRDDGGVVVRWDPSFALAKDYKVEFSETSSFTRTIDSKRVDNTAYAPTMKSNGFRDGGPLYWRVGAVDEGGNQGGWASGRVGLLRRMNVSATGGLRRGRTGVMQVRVTDAKGRKVRKARVTVRGVGVHARSRRTSKGGMTRFRLRPRTRGTLRVRVDKRGYRPGAATLSVR